MAAAGPGKCAAPTATAARGAWRRRPGTNRKNLHERSRFPVDQGLNDRIGGSATPIEDLEVVIGVAVVVVNEHQVCQVEVGFAEPLRRRGVTEDNVQPAAGSGCQGVSKANVADDGCFG